MLIPCPHCGARDIQEFAFLGAAGTERPCGLAATEAAMFEYVYQRANPLGLHEEFWYHGAGCHCWLVVRRNTFTHSIESVTTAKDARVGAAA
ncbi:sarcosine oxidase subunit delta [Bradyrhizobium sp. STM 3562]|uniref:sarcosine oxidase subunit delta n=1 Tax=Bradyrhizobium sp. STM 3562 TaxID=578924 RepID=UPI00388D2698